ncbi:TetR/AcrR family transcriptional regulator [Bacillus sp. MMSF_3353]|uniref:TetR/AcrR family transcriptional regulator n=1 Tax=Bacillus sp. MMSF_3353 TaxID=3047081 RepID=UPI00273D755F|nr:TetR/AcrR family transcriptional regulator [Bacillus sp. MMSF_3353]
MLVLRKSRQDGMLSQQYITEALGQLLQEKNLDDITITDLCKKAGVARVTFYKHYHTIYDVINASMQKGIDKFLKEITDLDPQDSLQLFIENLITAMANNRVLIKKLIDSNMSGLFLDYVNSAIKSIFETDNPMSNHMNRAQVLFFAGGLFNVLIDWIKRSSRESPQSLAQKIYEMLPIQKEI